MTHAENLCASIEAGDAVVAVIGLGYVGLPLAHVFHSGGLHVLVLPEAVASYGVSSLAFALRAADDFYSSCAEALTCALDMQSIEHLNVRPIVSCCLARIGKETRVMFLA